MVRAVVALALLALAVFAGRTLAASLVDLATQVERLGAWGPVAFVAAYVVATVLFVPGSVLTLAAGVLFGLARGTAFTFVGATLGAAAAFLVARHGGRRFLERRISATSAFAQVDRAVAGQGFRVVLLLRLSPLFPFNLLNYALGLTRVRFVDYLLASVGMLPGTFLYVYYGTAIGSLAAVASGQGVERGPGYWVVMGVGLAATLVVTAVVTRLARRALRSEHVEEGA